MNFTAILNILKAVLAGLSAVATGLLANEAAGAPLPPWLKTVCLAIVGLAGSFGLVSAGLVKAPEPAPALDKSAALDVLKGAGPKA